MTMNQIAREQMLPQLRYFFQKLSKEKEQVTVDGFAAFKGNDKFLPGKIAAGLGDVLLRTPVDDPQFAQNLADYRAIADLTLQFDNDTWGIYYYLLTLYKLQGAGLLDRAISPATLAALKQKLDWRKFVRPADYTLINLPTNYYGVAFSVARLRMLLGWEDETASKALLEKMLKHYQTYSGKFGFSDETDGEGRFDRYSILLAAEICERYVETGLPVTPELKALLRKSADIALNIANTAGDGFSFGRSIGPYGDTAALEILSVAAYLKVLTPEEQQYAYAYSTRIFAKYVDFWFDPAAHSVDMWGKGRRTDAYRGRHRILGENLSLLHQFLSANDLWNRAGFENAMPKADLSAWLDRTQPKSKLIRFAQGEYDRALAIFRDGEKVFSLLLVNGGAGQHANSPYYPLPFSNGIVAGTPDSGYRHAQLMPRFTLADGSQLMATAYQKNIVSEQDGSSFKVRYRQDELTRLGGNAPVKDARLKVETTYTLAPGVITRTDKYTPEAALELRDVTLDFGSFSEDAKLAGQTVNFANGAVYEYQVSGLKDCSATVVPAGEDFKSPGGAMKTVVSCALKAFTLKEPLTIQWTLKYR